MWFDALVIVAALFGGGVAAVTGFGIGSLLTPAMSVDARLAVAVVLAGLGLVMIIRGVRA